MSYNNCLRHIFRTILYSPDWLENRYPLKDVLRFHNSISSCIQSEHWSCVLQTESEGLAGTTLTPLLSMCLPPRLSSIFKSPWRRGVFDHMKYYHKRSTDYRGKCHPTRNLLLSRSLALSLLHSLSAVCVVCMYWF